MQRRDFHKGLLSLGLSVPASIAISDQIFAQDETDETSLSETYLEPARQLPVRRFNVVVAGGGTGGVVAALAAARQGARVALVEVKGYTGGTVTEGGTALHSFFNLWKAFPGVEKKQVVQGLPQKIIDRLITIGATSGHAEMSQGYNYDSVCTAIDTELYKLATMEMLEEAGVFMALNSMVVGAIKDGDRIRGAIVESRNGREAFYADAFIDCTAYGDLSAAAGADFVEPNDYPVVNSIGMGNVSVEKLRDFLIEQGRVSQIAHGIRSGEDDQIVRLQGQVVDIPEFSEEARAIGLSMTTTTVHDDYFMFLKLNFKMGVSPTDRDEVARAELELRRRQYRALELFRKYVPGCEKAFIARTSPKLCIRRGRLITCEYDMTHEDVVEARHFEDEILTYGFHDSAPRIQIKNGGTYGLPYRTLLPKGIENLFAVGMMITSDHRAHMSTRNTVCCMGQGQAAGTAAALCSKNRCATRELDYGVLRDALVREDVYFEEA